jgi:succinate dehydrogenase / fumarate reductase membrane anchor subunit
MSGGRGGVRHWRWQRLSAVALVPLALWFLVGLIGLPDRELPTVQHWLAAPAHSLLVMLLLCSAALHAVLGLEVIVEDYVHAAAAKAIALLTIRSGYLLLVAAGCLAVLKIALGSAG